MSALEALKMELLAAVAQAADLAALEEVRVAALGKKGRITGLMADMRSLSPDERKERGQALNALKDEVGAALDVAEGRTAPGGAGAAAGSRADRRDPAGAGRAAGPHPPDQPDHRRDVAIFGEMGFSVAEGPHIEDDFYNFTALNIPPEHPARDKHDTFYLPDRASDGSRMVLRTHTSPVQIRTMLEHKPPMRIIVPGRTFRSDHDTTHSPMFHQVEGLVVDEKTSMGHLKGCLIEFCRAFFDVDDLPVRFRPSYFPFTEPSAEVDIGCSRRGGELKIGDCGDWLEILGSGMVHPKVLANCGIDAPGTRASPSAWGSSASRC